RRCRVPDAKAMQYRIVDRSGDVAADERGRVAAGLLETPARIEPKYFYDELGCALYGAICQLPEYYPTRTELALFREHRGEIAEAMGRGRQFVDLGAGDCCKGQAWLPFLAPTRYIAVDIARNEIERSLARMAPDFPEVEMVGVVADFSAGLPLQGVLAPTPATFFYPGSSIGNFVPDEAVRFLGSIRELAAARPGSGLLIGVDGKKSSPVLDAAYDDALGVTAAFNRNVLLHLNRRFGFDFALEGYEHRGFYNAAAGRVEMHLEALRDQVVTLGEANRRAFARGDRIHTENSYKYHASEFEALLRSAGFDHVRHWPSAEGGYFVFYAS
ncbi:MAG TPA: L-histidine N(alpha)-methyltransferase, partial [Usitatibacter sp.]|nr:L-histidine N(alpha)-methyltransferase [Usitatibacter sp.]